MDTINVPKLKNAEHEQMLKFVAAFVNCHDIVFHESLPQNAIVSKEQTYYLGSLHCLYGGIHRKTFTFTEQFMEITLQ